MRRRADRSAEPPRKVAAWRRAADAILAEPPGGLRDAFREAGIGWGGTILNDWPIHRIDQIWAGPALRAVETRAIATRHSEHRMTMAEFESASPVANARPATARPGGR